MRIYCIFNPNAGSAEQARAVLEELKQFAEVTAITSESKESTIYHAVEGARQGYDVIVAGGGDGTAHAVVNGLASVRSQARLLILPLGTGNDLRRTLGIPDDPMEAVQLVQQGQQRAIDLMRVETPHRTHYGVNLASGGFGGVLQESMTEEVKANWGPLAYLRSAAEALHDLRPYEVELTLDTQEPIGLRAFNVIVANGRYAARGWRVASPANPEDGLLDVVVVPGTSLFDLAEVGSHLLTGDYLDSEAVLHYRTCKVRLSAEPPMDFSLDGEAIHDNPLTFTALPQALRVLVGSEYETQEGIA